MCQIQKNLQVTMTADQVMECIDEMHDKLSPAERMTMLEALYPKRSEIIELLRLNKETEENSDKTGMCPAYWPDGDLYKMLKLMFDPRGVMSKGQLACVNEVIYNNY